MVKLYFLLWYEFTKIGFFALGGGYATLPFLYFLQEKYNWYSIEELTNMIAVSNITPGPIGINMATYTGYTTAGIVGSTIATLSLIYTPFILTVITTKLITKFKNCSTVTNIFLGLRPAACALLASIGLKLFFQIIINKQTEIINTNKIDYCAIILFILLILPFSRMKKNPLLIIFAGALGGIVIKSIHHILFA